MTAKLALPAVAASRNFRRLAAVALLARAPFVVSSTLTLHCFSGSSRVDVRSLRRSLSGKGQALLYALRVFVLTDLHKCIVQKEARGSAQFVRETRVQQTRDKKSHEQDGLQQLATDNCTCVPWTT
ncbi:hypothetical protein MRX96_003013 [Rhipicephalus microplus]